MLTDVEKQLIKEFPLTLEAVSFLISKLEDEPLSFRQYEEEVNRALAEFQALEAAEEREPEAVLAAIPSATKAEIFRQLEDLGLDPKEEAGQIFAHYCNALQETVIQFMTQRLVGDLLGQLQKIEKLYLGQFLSREDAEESRETIGAIWNYLKSCLDLNLVGFHQSLVYGESFASLIFRLEFFMEQDPYFQTEREGIALSEDIAAVKTEQEEKYQASLDPASLAAGSFTRHELLYSVGAEGYEEFKFAIEGDVGYQDDPLASFAVPRFSDKTGIFSELSQIIVRDDAFDPELLAVKEEAQEISDSEDLERGIVVSEIQDHCSGIPSPSSEDMLQCRGGSSCSDQAVSGNSTAASIADDSAQGSSEHRTPEDLAEQLRTIKLHHRCGSFKDAMLNPYPLDSLFEPVTPRLSGRGDSEEFAEQYFSSEASEASDDEGRTSTEVKPRRTQDLERSSMMFWTLNGSRKLSKEQLSNLVMNYDRDLFHIKEVADTLLFAGANQCQLKAANSLDLGRRQSVSF